MSNNQDIIEFPASSYDGEPETRVDAIARIVAAVALVAMFVIILALMGQSEQEALEAHGEFMGRLEEQGAWVLR